MANPLTFSFPRLVLAGAILAVSGIRGDQLLPPAPEAAPELPAPFVQRHRTEQHWVVDSIVTDLVTLAAFGRPSPRVEVRIEDDGSEAPHRFVAAIEGREPTTITLDHAHSVWTPATYERLVRSLAERQGQAVPATSPLHEAADPLAGIVALDVSRLYASQADLSARLTRTPRSPDLHERAALLLGGLALREAAGYFTDARPLMSRMTVHLAMAHTLRPGGAAPSLHGRLAAASLLTLIGRQAEAMDVLDDVARHASSPAATAFVRGLRTRITLDWRVTPSVDASPFEKVQVVKALIARLDSSAAALFIEQYGDEGRPDWGRLLLAEAPSVGTWNTYGPVAVALEIAEIDRLRALAGGVAATGPARLDALNATGSRLVHGTPAEARIEVVDWGLWADILQRQLAHALVSESRRLRRTLALPEEADMLEASRDKAFGGLRLHPVIFTLRATTNVATHTAMTLLPRIWRDPERLPPLVWRAVRDKARSVSREDAMASEQAWFRPSVPTGTTLENMTGRTDGALAVNPSQRLAELDYLIGLAPYRRSLLLERLELRYGNAADPALVERELGRFLPYDVFALRRLGFAQPPGSPQRIRTFERLCEMLVDQCQALISELLDQGQDDRAAGPYRRWFYNARDDVRAAAHAFWLANYELDHGRRNEAYRVARIAADTGAHGGLVALASVLEREGQDAEAHTLFKRASARYDAHETLLSFYLRYRDTVNAVDYRDETARLMARLFPRGLEPMTLAAFTANRVVAPDAGLKVAEPWPKLASTGIREGDIIVALDGIRIRHVGQYLTIARLTRGNHMRLIYWNGDAYAETTGRFVGRDFPGKLVNWIPAATSGQAASR